MLLNSPTGYKVIYNLLFQGDTRNPNVQIHILLVNESIKCPVQIKKHKSSVQISKKNCNFNRHLTFIFQYKFISIKTTRMTTTAQFNVVSNKRNHLYRVFLIRLRLLKCTRLALLLCSQTITSTRCFLLTFVFRKCFTLKARYILKRERKSGP